MAYLYETATWRAIVKATRDPKLMAVFVATTTAGAYAVAKGSQLLTTPASEEARKEMEKTVKKDYEAGRYARHSKQALAVMFESVRKDGVDDARDDTQKSSIKLPGVMWHPKVAQREKEERIHNNKARESKKVSPTDQSAESSKVHSRGETAS